MQKLTRSIWTHRQSRTKPKNAYVPLSPPCGRETELQLLSVLRITMSPRGEWQQTNRARTVHTTTCRRPLGSCAVNYVHKFRIYSGSTWMAGRATWSRNTERRVRDYLNQRQTSAESEHGRQVLRVCLLSHGPTGSTTPAGIVSAPNAARG